METQHTITARQRRAIEALTAGLSESQAAERAGVHRSTLHRWRQQATFAQALTDARRCVFDEALQQLETVSTAAVATLRDLLTDRTTPAHVRCSAALGVLKQAHEARSALDFEQRLQTVERLLQQQGRSAP